VHRNSCVVGPHHGRLKGQFPLQVVQRSEKFGRSLHPVAHGASRNVDARTRENVFQAVQRKMIAELADDYFRDQPRPGDAARNGPWRQRGRGDAVLATTASVFRPYVNMGFQLGRHIFQFPRDVFTDAVHRAATARTGFLFIRQVMLVADLPQLIPIDLTPLATTMAFDFGFGFLVPRRGVFRFVGRRRV